MDGWMEVPKRERLAEFFRRLLATPNATTFDEAVHQITSIMDAVEDERAGIPYNPENDTRVSGAGPPRRASIKPESMQGPASAAADC